MTTFTLHALIQFLQDKNLLQELPSNLPDLTLIGFSPLHTPQPYTLVWTRVCHLICPRLRPESVS